MNEWASSIQRMVDWLEEHLCENPTLLDMSRQVGYSPYYCSTKFHEIVGMTIKSYISGRRLALATQAICETKRTILDIAVDCGYSSHEALTRAFALAYGCTPSELRKQSAGHMQLVCACALPPWKFNENGDMSMTNTILTEARVRMEYIPAHRYIGIWDIEAQDYGSFWARHDCDAVCGVIDSMAAVSDPIVTCHTAGWFYEGGRRGYFYGFGVPADYNGEVPEGFEIRDLPGSHYMVFHHPPFDYPKDCGTVMGRVEHLAWNFDPSVQGFAWNEDCCQDYQRHYPEGIGYEVLRPVRRV